MLKPDYIQPEQDLKKESDALALSLIKEFKDVILAKEQAEALKRITKPATIDESLGLGNFTNLANICLASLSSLDSDLKRDFGIENSGFEEFAYLFAVGTGSSKAIRMLNGYKTIEGVGQLHLFNTEGGIPSPEKIDPND